MSGLEKALSRLLGHNELTGRLARVLARASKGGRVSYREVEKIVNGDAKDVLLLASEWRLLLPVRTIKSAAWEDRMLVTNPEEMYELPNIVRYLVEDAQRTGYWNPRRAIAKLFGDMGEPNREQVPKLVERLGEQAENCRITAVQISEICSELGMGDGVDALIAQLKGSGVISPKLGPLAEVSRAAFPIYELNPSLFAKKGEKE